MSSVAEYEAAGVPARQLGRSFAVWKKTDLVTILHHFGVDPNLRHRQTGSKLELLRRLDQVTQRHGLTVEDRKLILGAKGRDHSLTPNGRTRLEGSHRRAWERRLTEIVGPRRRVFRRNGRAFMSPLDSDDDEPLQASHYRCWVTASPSSIPSDSDDDERLLAVVSPTRATNSPPSSPPVGRGDHFHSPSGSVSGANRLSSYGERGGSLVRPTAIEPTVSSLVDNEPVINTSSGPTDEGSSARGPIEREIRERLLERPRTIQPTTSISAVSEPAASTIATSGSTQERSSARGPIEREIREGLLERSRIIQPTTSISVVAGPATGALATTTTTGDGSSARGPNEKECSICLDSFGLERFPKRSITSTCNHAPDVCLSCLAQSIAAQFSNKVWDQIDCPTCSQRLQHADIKMFASSVVFGKYV